MSATIGNLNEIATFLKADVYTRNFRPVELKEYVKCGSEIFAIDPSAQSTEEAFTSERTVDFGVSITHFFWIIYAFDLSQFDFSSTRKRYYVWILII